MFISAVKQVFSVLCLEHSMAKKKWLLHILKKLFLCEPGNPSNKETKRWGWIYGKSKKLKQLPEVTTTQSNLNDVREEHMKHVLNVARATAAAAEAAVAAAQAAAAVVRLTGMAQTTHQNHQRQNWAAIIIQTAFRGYLARKALRALKGVVRLQAIVRGRAARRQVKFELKRSPSFTRLAQVRRTRTLELGEAIRVGERRWNDDMCTKEEAESMSLRRQEAVSRRDRMKQYSFSHRERQLQYTQILEDPLFSRKYNERQWGGEKLYRSGFPPSMKQRIVPRLEDHIEEPQTNPRRSFSQLRERSSGEESVSPSYMATTESTKARMRSMSTPRQRIRFLDHYYEHGDCYMNMKPTWTALNCEAMNSISTGPHQLKSLSVRSFKLS